jgi:hypothetical protein
MMQGNNLEDVATGIDEIMIRQPLRVTTAVIPFNFQSMTSRQRSAVDAGRLDLPTRPPMCASG